MLGADFPRLLHRAQGGDEAAFETLWRDANPVLLRYLLVVADPSSADDVAAETWLHVVRGLDGFTGDERAWRAWLMTVARRRAVDAGRLRQRRPTAPLEDGDEPAPTPSAEAGALESMDTRAALELVAGLPPHQAEAVVLRVVAGLDVKQVAELLGSTPGAVRVAVHRGLARLRTQLQTDQTDEV